MAIKKVKTEVIADKDKDIRLKMERNVKFLGEKITPVTTSNRDTHMVYGKGLKLKRDTSLKDIF